MKRIVAPGDDPYLRELMLNDRSSPIVFLETRRSAKPRELVGSGPSPEELDRILAIGSRTPDHGRLHPWRFVVVGSDQRDAFEAVLRQALAEHDPCASVAHHQKEQDFAHYPGQLVVVVSAPVPNHKIPVWEQELACGAAAMNLLHGANAIGYVGGWVTGWRAYSEPVRQAFCGERERIAGFIYIGEPGRPLEERERPSAGEVVSHWQPPAL